MVPGLVVGVLMAAGLARLAQAALIGVNVLNPLSYLGVVLLQCAIIGLACLAPALRASNTRSTGSPAGGVGSGTGIRGSGIRDRYQGSGTASVCPGSLIPDP